MATKKVFEIYAGGQETASIEYNDANLKIGNINFTIPTGFTANVLIWDSGNLVFGDSYQAGSYSESVPGNYQVTEHTDPDDGSTYATLPPEIAWCVSWVAT